MPERIFLLHVLSAESCFFVVLLTGIVYSTLVVVPSDTVAVNGTDTRLYCSTNLSAPVHWQHISLGSTLPTDVYLQNTIVNGYVGRFQVQVDTNTGVYNLVINNVQFSDAGIFRCLDNRGAGEQKDAKLSVTENKELQLSPKFAEVQEGESFQFTCKTYYKNQSIVWQRIPMGITLPVDVYMQNRLVNEYGARYEVTMEIEAGINRLIIKRAEERDSGIFRCIDRSGHGQQVDSQLTVVGPPECHSTVNASCELEDMKNVTLTCSVSFFGKTPPTIEWKDERGKISGAISISSSDKTESYLTIQIEQGGSYSSPYSCLSVASNSTCTIRIQHNCTVSDGSTGTPKTEPLKSDDNIAAIVVPIVVVIGIIIIIIAFVIKRRLRKKQKETDRVVDRDSGVPLNRVNSGGGQ